MWRFANFLSRGISQRIHDLAVRTPREFPIDDEEKNLNKNSEKIKDNIKSFNHISKEKVPKKRSPNSLSISPSLFNNQINYDSSSETNDFEASFKETESKLNHMIGLSFLKDENYIKALPWIKSSSDLGNPKAQFNLALCYEQGLGVKMDLQKARLYYLKSAEAGHPIAQYNLAIFYANGLGGSPSCSKSRHYMELAASQGVP